MKGNSEADVTLGEIIFNSQSFSISYPRSLTFSDVDKWIRCRFDIKTNEKLLYYNKLGEGEVYFLGPLFLITNILEIIPSGQISHIEVKKLEAKNHHSRLSSINSHSLWSFVVFCIPPVLFLLLATSLGTFHYREQITPAYNDFIKSCCSFFGLSTIWHSKMIESYIAFLTWSFTYLFVRRLLNPETATMAFEKFSVDAVFGGLAAAMAIILKHILKGFLLS